MRAQGEGRLIDHDWRITTAKRTSSTDPNMTPDELLAGYEWAKTVLLAEHISSA